MEGGGIVDHLSRHVLRKTYPRICKHVAGGRKTWPWISHNLLFTVWLESLQAYLKSLESSPGLQPRLVIVPIGCG